LIAEIENEVAGYAKIKSDSREDCIADGKTLELCRLYALDRFIGKGVGRALMLEYLNQARRGELRRLLARRLGIQLQGAGVLQKIRF
jgi:GNAT superfamily N-acetyltransferase